MGGRRGIGAIHLYVAAVVLGGTALIAFYVSRGAVHDLLRADGKIWLFSLFLLLGEILPVEIPRQQEKEEMTTSGTFGYAMVLASGTGVAVLIHALATLAADLGRRKPWYKAAFNASQYVVALAACGATLRVLTGVPKPGPEPFAIGDLPGILLSAVVLLVLNHAFTRVAIALVQGQPIGPALREDFRFHLATTMVMLGHSPVIVVAANWSLALVPLLALPMVSVYKTTSVWLEKQYKEHQALHDALTRLPNRNLFHDRLAQAIRGARRSKARVGILLIDLDRFKEINDALGHQIGDLLLQQIGPRLLQALRDSDTIARLGGDEFGVLLPQVADEEAALRVADKIHGALEEPFRIDGMTLDVEASIGIALYPDHGADVNTLLQRADVAMYLAKASHTGNEVYAASRDTHSASRLAMLSELRRALVEDQFVLHYQPKADMRTGEVTGVEALVRWRHPRRGLIQPDEFIPVAEHTGFIKPLTLHVLNESLRQCRLWHDAGLPLRMAVNLAVRSLQDPAFPDQLGRLLRAWEVDPSSLELEITESALMVDPVRTMGVLADLSRMGIGLSLDDFGTGYSSLVFLKRLPVAEVKIDRSFVINMVEDENDGVIVRSTIDLARNLGLRVVAEGVETGPTWQTLASLGCDMAQGHYLGRPMPADQLIRWLEERHGEHAPNGTPAPDGNGQGPAASREGQPATVAGAPPEPAERPAR